MNNRLLLASAGRQTGDPYFSNVVSLLHLANDYVDVKGTTWTLTGTLDFTGALALAGTAQSQVWVI